MNEAERMNTAMSRIRDQQDNNNQLLLPDERSLNSGQVAGVPMNVVQNPFKERHQSASMASQHRHKQPNLDGGLLYGVSDRDQWLLARDEEITIQDSQQE